MNRRKRGNKDDEHVQKAGCDCRCRNGRGSLCRKWAAQGTLNVTYYGVWDRWGTNGGKGLAMADWSDLNGTITLNITFNDTVDQAETDDASVQASWSGKTATFTFASTASNPLTIGIHIDHGTSIDDLKMTGFTYSVN